MSNENPLETKSAELEKIIKWYRGDIPSPARINFRITGKCNLNCLSCEKGLDYNRMANNGLSKEKIYEIVEEACDIGIDYITIDGSGEPFMRKDILLNVMKKAKEGGMQGDIVTNGTLLTENIIENIVNIGWDRVQLSIDAPDTKTHDYLRGKIGTFEKVIKTAKMFKKKKNEMGKNKPKIDVSTVLSNLNFDKIPEILELLDILGVRGFNLQPLQNRSEESEKMKLEKDEVRKFRENIEKCEKIIKRSGIETDIRLFEREEMVNNSFNLGEEKKKRAESKNDDLLSIPCHLPLINISISEDGYVEPCEQLNFEEENIRNKNLKEIWYGDFFSRIRESLKNGKLFGGCKNCCGSQVIETEELRRRLKDFNI